MRSMIQAALSACRAALTGEPAAKSRRRPAGLRSLAGAALMAVGLLSAGAAAAQTAPTVATSTPANVSTTSATLGGNVSSDGGDIVNGRGVVYSSTNTTPTLGGSGVTQAPNGTGTGSFSASIPGLTPTTTYYVRAYASNRIGTAYGAVQSFRTAFAPATITISPTTIPPAVAGVAYSQQLTASGGTAPYSYAVVGGALPAGITLSASGVLSGVTNAPGTFNFRVQARDATTPGQGGPFFGEQAYTLTVNPAPVPTLSEWAMILLALALAGAAAVLVRRRTAA